LNGGILGLNNTTSLTSAYGVFALAEQGYYLQAGKWPSVPPGTINISSSLRWRSSASAYMTRTPAVAGNRQKFTMSLWIKRGTTTSTGQWIFSASSGSANQDCYLCWGGSVSTGGSQDTLAFFSPPAGNNVSLITTAVYRDFSAWYHIVCAVDTTQATAANRILLYVNGAQVTSFSTATYPTLNQNLNFNNTQPHLIGSASVTPANFLDGYLGEFNYVDGQQLTASSFGTYDGNGIWQPVGYNGSYGTTGFHLTFGNTTSTSTLGNDTSGNSNNFTTNNFSLTAGTTYDAMTDSPTPYSATVGNYAVFNSIFYSGGTKTLSNGNLTAAIAFSTTYPILAGTIGMSSGKWYWETTIVSVGSSATVGIGQNEVPSATTSGGGSITSWFYTNTANIYHNAIQTAYGATFTTGDVIGAAFDAGAGTLTFYKNGVSQGVAASGIPAGTYYPYISNGGGTGPTMTVNFGQQPFTYTAPSGYLALNTYNLAASTIPNGAAYFASTLYTGNGTNSPNALIITNSAYNNAGTAFQPDFTWVKSRSLVSDHILQDSVRGLSEFLVSDTTGAAQATGGGDVSAYTSTGFNISYNNTRDNQAAATYVAWQWQAGKGTTATNTNGSITSTVSANTTAGFSVVTYTGTGAAATIGHGLNVSPDLMIVKSRNTASTSWAVYHSALGGTKYILLDSTAAAVTNSTEWNNLSPTSSLINVGGSGITSFSGRTYVAYCWNAVSGFSAFGSYTGNGSTDGPFVYTGFRPRWLLLKDVPDATAWFMFDSSRDTYNVVGQYIQAQSSSAEATQASVDFLSNGFKLRVASDPNRAVQYIYAAFAENPFNTARAR
jgi:hypothetical protein